jgi:hypothetical protein
VLQKLRERKKTETERKEAKKRKEDRDRERKKERKTERVKEIKIDREIDSITQTQLWGKMRCRYLDKSQTQLLTSIAITD